MPDVSITLDADRWNLVFNLLGEGPYKIVAPLIQEMGQQYQKALAPPPPAQTPTPPKQDAKPNGHDPVPAPAPILPGSLPAKDDSGSNADNPNASGRPVDS